MPLPPFLSRPLGLIAAIGIVGMPGFQLQAATLDPNQVEFFESKVRPLLADHCYECHSARSEKVQGGLRLDTQEGWKKGGTSGEVLIPGKPGDSLLIHAVKGTLSDGGIMPPKKSGPPLKPEQVAVLEEWIRMGAPDPRTGNTQAHAKPSAPHWAFIPPKDASPPRLNPEMPTGNNDVDAFIRAKLVEKGLSPAPRADKRTLLRRATLDLTGLPPTPEEMQGFLADSAPDAFETAVDRLLASPRYGERWGRHWLDIARYADSKGYVFEEERRFSHSFTYRDWVVNALNQDLPYDQFLIQQIAGDQVATPENPWPMAAQGFLTLGRRFLNNQHDIIDDRIDVLSRGVMGLTVACARCHDHKSDPIPSADYYSLYGVFNSSQEPGDKPLLGPNPNPQRAAAYEKERADRNKDLQEYRAQQTAEVAKKLRDRAGDYLLAAQESMGLDWANLEGLARVRSLDPGLVGAWKGRLEQWQGSTNSVFNAWFALAKLGTNEFAAKAPEIVRQLAAIPAGTSAPNRWVIQSLQGSSLNSFKDVALAYGKVLSEAEAAWKTALELAQTQGVAAPTSLADPDREALRLILNATDSPVVTVIKDVDRFFATPVAQKIRALKRKVDELDATHPGAPLRAMALLDKKDPVEPVVFKRGNPGNPGAQVPRQFLGAISGTNRVPFTQGSGRLELARQIASRDNPLTARVMVNRVWLRHFGSPLVRTPSDFGVRTEPATHPELLDHLAVWFMDHGWSLKELHRYLMLSATYQQASDPGQDNRVHKAFALAEASDPGNTLLWRMNRKRADFEAMRDGLLMVSGALDGDIGGQPVTMFEQDSTPRRTLYGYIDRQNLPGILRAFDFASPDTTSPLRFQTTTPQQALFLMNSPFAVQQARSFINRPEVSRVKTVREKVEQLYQLAFQRSPSPEEMKLAEDFLKRPVELPPEPPPTATWTYGTGSYSAPNDRVEGWSPLPHFTGQSWQWESKLPSSQGQWTMLNSKGGHPGKGTSASAIRRWTAPMKGWVSVSAILEHSADQGDGVVGRIVSSRQGSLGSWKVFHGKASTDVQRLEIHRGETLDFVVEPGSNENSDSFQWAPVIQRLEPTGLGSNDWKAERDFAGRQNLPIPLDPWQQFAQVLLSANEFVFVD